MPIYNNDRYRRPSPLQPAMMPSPKRAPPAASVGRWVRRRRRTLLCAARAGAPGARVACAPLCCPRARGMRSCAVSRVRDWHARLHALHCTADACCTCCSAQLNACGREGTWHARAARSQEHVTAARDALHRHARGVGHAKDGPAQRSRDCFVRVSGEHRRADGCRQAHDTGQHPVGLCPVVPENPFSYRHC